MRREHRAYLNDIAGSIKKIERYTEEMSLHGAIALGAQQRVGMVNLLNQTGPVRSGLPFLKYRNQPVKAPGCQFLFFCACY